MTQSPEYPGTWTVVNVISDEIVAEFAQAWPAHLRQAELGDDYEVRLQESTIRRSL